MLGSLLGIPDSGTEPHRQSLPCFSVLGCAEGRRVVVPGPGAEPVPHAAEAQSPNHQTTREVPGSPCFLHSHTVTGKKPVSLKTDFSRAVKMINCACLNLSALAFLIICLMKQEVRTEYNTSAAHREAMLSPGKPLVLLFES